MQVLLSDNAAARDCAKLNGVHTTEGDAVHLGSRPSFARKDVDKLMLDWCGSAVMLQQKCSDVVWARSVCCV